MQIRLLILAVKMLGNHLALRISNKCIYEVGAVLITHMKISKPKITIPKTLGVKHLLRNGQIQRYN